MMQIVELKFKCIFCNTATNFKDGGKAYCINCYCKLRNTAHTHDTPQSLPKPLKITPMPMPSIGNPGTEISTWPETTAPVVIC